MGEVLAFPEDDSACMTLTADVSPFFADLDQIVERAAQDAGAAADLTAFFERAARGIERIGHFKVEFLPDRRIRLSAHLSDSLARLFEAEAGPEVVRDE